MNAAPTVTIVTTSYPRSDRDEAGAFLRPLVEAFSAAGLSGTVIVPKDSEAESLDRSGDFSVRRVRYGLFTRGRLAFGSGIVPNLRANPLLLLQAPMLIAALARGAADATGQVLHANWVIAAFPALWVKLRRGTPYALTLRGEDLRLLRNPIIRALCRPAIIRAEAIITVGEHLRAELARLTGLAPSRIELIPNGVAVTPPTDRDYQDFLAQRRFAECRYLLLFVGTVIPRKNVEALIDLIAAPALTGARLVVCGRTTDRSELQRLERHAAERGCADRIDWEGAVPPDRIPLYLRRADAYCSTSTFEGRPNAAIEALAAGKVVCLSDIPAHRELVGDGVNGIIVDPVASAAAAERLSGILADSERRAALERSASAAAAEFSWERTALAYRDVFRRIAGAKL